MKTLLAATLACASLGSTATVAGAAEVKFFCPVAMTTVMAELIPQFEREVSHKIVVDFATVGVITDRIMRGDAADVAIVSKQQSDELDKHGKIAAGSRAGIARVGYGMYMRKGAPRVDIQSVDALKRWLLAAPSIAYSDPAGGAPSAIYASRLMERLGIAVEVKPKTKLLPPGESVPETVAKGDAAIGFGLTTATTPAVELVSLPAEVQSYTEYVAGLLVTSKQTEAGKALITFLSSSAAQSILKSKGFEPR